MTEVRIGGNANNVTVYCLELLHVVTESDDFRWTHKCAGTTTFRNKQVGEKVTVATVFLIYANFLRKLDSVNTLCPKKVAPKYQSS